MVIKRIKQEKGKKEKEKYFSSPLKFSNFYYIIYIQ